MNCLAIARYLNQIIFYVKKEAGLGSDACLRFVLALCYNVVMEKFQVNRSEKLPSETKRSSVSDKIKPNFVKRHEAGRKIKERGFEKISDFAVSKITIEKIETMNRKSGDYVFEKIQAEKVFGKITYSYTIKLLNN